MLGKINSDDGRHEVSHDTPKRAPPAADYRQIERDRQRPPSKEDQQKTVDKKPRSVYELSKEKPKTTESPKGKPKQPVSSKEPKKDEEEEISFMPEEEPQIAEEELPVIKEKGETLKKEVKPFESKEEPKTTKKEKTKGRESETTNPEKGVAGAAVHSPIQGAAFHSEKTPGAQEASRSATIRDLAAQIIDKIQVMRREDQTSTIITLRHPPVLAGATITLTTSDQAKSEFNISFANLTPDAKVFLDRKLKEDSLTETLERKGIVVNTLTTTTEPEKIITAEGQATRDRSDQRDEQQQKQQRQFQAPEDEENL